MPKKLSTSKLRQELARRERQIYHIGAGAPPSHPNSGSRTGQKPKCQKVPVGATVYPMEDCPVKDEMVYFLLPILQKRGDIIYSTRKIRGFFHRGRYYLHAGELADLEEYNVVAIHDRTRPQKKVGGLNEIGLLMEYGYNVDKKKGLSKEQRRWILEYVMEHDKKGTFDFVSECCLGFNIRLAGDNPKMADAVQKWKDDLKYIQDNPPSEKKTRKKSSRKKKSSGAKR